MPRIVVWRTNSTFFVNDHVLSQATWQRHTEAVGRFVRPWLTINPARVEVRVVAEGVDCALRIGELPSSSLVARRIGMATMITCAAPRYLKEHGEPKTLKDLSAHRGVTFLSGQNQRPLAWQFMGGGSEQSHISRQGITVNESNAYVECVVAGFGILQAPGITLDRFLADGTLVEVLRAYRPHPRPVSVLYPSRSHLAPQVEVFVDWVREQFPKLYGRWLES